MGGVDEHRGVLTLLSTEPTYRDREQEPGDGLPQRWRQGRVEAVAVRRVAGWTELGDILLRNPADHVGHLGVVVLIDALRQPEDPLRPEVPLARFDGQDEVRGEQVLALVGVHQHVGERGRGVGEVGTRRNPLPQLPQQLVDPGDVVLLRQGVRTGLVRLVVDDEGGEPTQDVVPDALQHLHDLGEHGRVLLHHHAQELLAQEELSGVVDVVEVLLRRGQPTPVVADEQLLVQPGLGLVAKVVVHPGEHDHQSVSGIGRLRDDPGEVAGLPGLDVADHQALAPLSGAPGAGQQPGDAGGLGVKGLESRGLSGLEDSSIGGPVPVRRRSQVPLLEREVRHHGHVHLVEARHPASQLLGCVRELILRHSDACHLGDCLLEGQPRVVHELTQVLCEVRELVRHDLPLRRP